VQLLLERIIGIQRQKVCKFNLRKCAKLKVKTENPHMFLF